MALPAPIQALYDRLQTYNGDPYNAQTNAGGLARGGNQNPIGNFIKLVRDFSAYGKAIAESVQGAGQEAADAEAAATASQQSATNAAGSATNAAGSATAAAGSATAAAATYDDFDDRFLGAKASDPAKDNDGNTLIVGAVYFNTTDNLMKVWSGTAWQYWVPNAADYLAKSGGRMTGYLSSAVKDHGTLGAVTEEYKYADANTHKVTVNGAHVINPTGMSEGDVMQINILYQSGSIAVSGTTQWELGGGAKSSNFSDIGVALTANAAYRVVFEMVAGVRTGVFQ
ncbi:hypothetical protein [Aureimonas sp. N4]|uniref:hypothetical protein n=1 Tax=Aureimonas sp. N4 TaxID=1638165 RepID=UPI000785194D|nr:hypothetical protein [Aureimonas sp. N4]